MSTPTTARGLPKGVDADNWRTYLKTDLADALDTIDGTTAEVTNANAYTSLQDAIDAAPVGGVVDVPADVTTTATITVAKALTLRGHGHTITMLTAGTTLLDVNASDVTIEGLTLVGVQGASSSANEQAINATGTSAAAPLTNVLVRGCTIRDWGFYGIYLKWVEGFRLERNNIANVWYAGIGCECVQRGWIEDNLVDGINGTPNAYGVYLSRPTTANLTTEPRSGNVMVARNIVRNVPAWEGLDTHGGTSIHFVDNQVIGCLTGIVVGRAESSPGVETYAPLYCTVVGNTIASGVTDGSAGAGIIVNGASGGEKALGVRVADNTVVGHGTQSLNTYGGIVARDSLGLQLVNNDLIECSPHGIVLLDGNIGVVVSGGTIVDPWTTANSIAAGVYLQASPITGRIGGFSVVSRNEIQRVTITGTPTGGTFTLTFSGQTTAGIAYNATAATVQAALEALSNIGVGDVVATGGPLPGTAASVEFTGVFVGTNPADMTASAAGLTGGSSPAVTIAVTQATGKVAAHVLNGGAIISSGLATIDYVLTPYHTNAAPRQLLSATAVQAFRLESATRFGAFGVTPVVQPAAAAQAAAPAGGTGTAAGGWDTAANRDAAIATINAMRTALINLGLMKGSA